MPARQAAHTLASNPTVQDTVIVVDSDLAVMERVDIHMSSLRTALKASQDRFVLT